MLFLQLEQIGMDWADRIKGSSSNQSENVGVGNYQGAKGRLSQMDCENKKAAVHAEMARVNKLPSNSTYAVHRLKVLNKILHLLSVPVSRLTLFEHWSGYF